MGISPQLTQDFNSTQNDKDLIETQNVQDFNSNKKPPKIPDYAKDYKNEYLFIIGIDKAFEYYIENFDQADEGVFYKRLNTINKYLNKLEKYTTYKKIKAEEIKYSNTLLDLLHELVDNCSDESIRNVDDDFPGWSNLVNTIGRFHDMFYIVN